MDLAPMIGRFVCWVFAWAVLGAVAAGIMHDLTRTDTRLLMTIMVSCGAVVGAMGGSAYEIARAITANRNRS